MEHKIKRVLKIVLLFISLFIINILVFIGLAKMGFDINMTEVSYLLPPLFSTIFLLAIDKIKRNKDDNKFRN